MPTTSSRPLPRPLHLVSNSTNTSSLPTPLSAGAHGPLSAPLSRTSTNDSTSTKMRPSPRRQSSISYNTGSSKAQSPKLGRSSSLGSKTILEGLKEGARNDENSSPGQTLPCSQAGSRETEPVTLAEKHADLLRFIAQKESKCLELRTQLAQHEADLLLLKRKWERIVSKGLPSSVRSDVSTSVGADMLGGIREGVQNGLGRVFAVLEPSSAASPSSQPSTTTLLKSERPTQQLRRDLPASTSSSKRASISTASSSSTWDRSSLSESRSSASSLFDELSSLDRQSLASSIEGESTASPSLEDEASRELERSLQTIERSSSAVQSHTVQTDPNEDPLSRKRRPRPSSINFSQLSSSFASVSSESLTPLSKQVANWVPPGLNKRWEELKGSETLSKQSKRASILLTDVLAVLAPPIPPSPRTSTSSTFTRRSKPPQPPPHHSLGLASPDPRIGVSELSRVSKSASPSLLDEEDGCGMEDVLQPEVRAIGVPKEAREGGKEDDEWNW